MAVKGCRLGADAPPAGFAPRSLDAAAPSHPVRSPVPPAAWTPVFLPAQNPAKTCPGPGAAANHKRWCNGHLLDGRNRRRTTRCDQTPPEVERAGGHRCGARGVSEKHDFVSGPSFITARQQLIGGPSFTAYGCSPENETPCDFSFSQGEKVRMRASHE